jgi:hypothetical protein
MDLKLARQLLDRPAAKVGSDELHDLFLAQAMLALPRTRRS